MRNFFEEGDLLVAEVQAFFSDGAMSLHTRSLRYGKVSDSISRSVRHKANLSKLPQLRNGQLVVVQPVLVRRLKSHFYSLPCGVDLILGLNGYIWVSRHVKENEQEGEEGFDAEAVYSNRNDVRSPVRFIELQDLRCGQDIDSATRTAIARVSNVIRVLSAYFVPMTDLVLVEAYDWVVEQNCRVKDLLREDIAEAMIAAVTT